MPLLVARTVRELVASVLRPTPPTRPPAFALRARQPGDEAFAGCPPAGSNYRTMVPPSTRRPLRGEGMPSTQPHPPTSRRRAMRSPARWRGDPQGAPTRGVGGVLPSSLPHLIGHVASQRRRVIFGCRLAARHCHQPAAVDLMPHRGVATMPLFERLPAASECGSAEDLLAAPPRKVMRPLRGVPDRESSTIEVISSTRLKGTCGKFQSLILDIRIKD